MKSSFLLKTLISFALITPHLSQADESIEKSFIQKLDQLTSFQARFEQRVVESDGYVLDESQGVLSFERPSKLYWHVNEPFPSILVSDSEKLYFYDPDLNQVTIRSWSSDPRENPVAVFVSDTDITEHYNISKGGHENDSQDEANAYVLTPKLDNGSYSELQVVFNSTGIESMEVLDSLGQITHVRFTELAMEENNLIPELPYEFQIPENAELIFDE